MASAPLLLRVQFFFFSLFVAPVMLELARDALTNTKRFEVVKGIISPVHDGYGKKVCFVHLHLPSCSSAWYP